MAIIGHNCVMWDPASGGYTASRVQIQKALRPIDSASLGLLHYRVSLLYDYLQRTQMGIMDTLASYLCGSLWCLLGALYIIELSSYLLIVKCENMGGPRT